MQIEVGKYYRTRDGRKVGPMAQSEWPECAHIEGQGGLWNWNGSPHFPFNEDTDSPYLIAEWNEAPTGPVRTVTRKEIVVTRKEIVPGVYGNVIVWNDGSGDVSVMNMRTATELRAAVATLSEIADALEGGAA